MKSNISLYFGRYMKLLPRKKNETKRHGGIYKALVAARTALLVEHFTKNRNEYLS